MQWNKFTILENGEQTKLELLAFLKEWYSSSEYITQLTSGSTGKPKKIQIKKKAMIASAQATNRFFGLTAASKAMLCISPAYIGGKMMIVRAIVSNMHLIVAAVSSSPLKQLKEVIDFCALVPLQVEMSVNNTQFDLIKTLIIGGAPVSDELEQKLKTKLTESYATFGMTETISHIAVRKLNGKNEAYQAVGSTNFASKEGCLVIHAEHLDILNLVTNDAVELINSTNFYWKGRVDYVINSGGVKIHPEALEQKLKSQLKIQNLIVFGLPDKKLGTAVQLLVEGKKESLPANWKINLKPYEIPKNLYFLDAFEYTTSGKVDRNRTIGKLNFER